MLDFILDFANIYLDEFGFKLKNTINKFYLELAALPNGIIHNLRRTIASWSVMRGGQMLKQRANH